MHTSVLLNEVINGLDIQKTDIVFDGTTGAGGHSAAIAERLGEDGTLIAIDLDIDAIKRVEEKLQNNTCTIHVRQSNFRAVDSVLNELQIEEIDKSILDLGLSSYQLEESGRGFSFQKNEPLLMTFNKNPSDHDTTVELIVNTWSEESIADILFGFGEEKYARKIARGIIERRKTKKIETTDDLIEIIKNTTPQIYQKKKIHPATKTFQALRIAANDELGSLQYALEKIYHRTSHRGRIAVISFHSIEDRIVKNFFREKEDRDAGVRLTKKPITPTEEEIKENPRSRSAKLRIFEKNKNNEELRSTDKQL